MTISKSRMFVLAIIVVLAAAIIGISSAMFARTVKDPVVGAATSAAAQSVTKDYASGNDIAAVPAIEPAIAPISVSKPAVAGNVVPSVALVADTTTSAGIFVSGQGVVNIKPDLVRFQVGVELNAKTVAEAQQQASTKITAVTAALKKGGVADEDIKTIDYSIRPNYIYNPNQAPLLSGYIVNNNLSVTVRDITKAGSLIDASGVAGANIISNISFGVANDADAIKKARTLAVEDARAKADQLAAAAKVNINTVVRISEQLQNYVPPQNAAEGGRGAGPAAAPATALQEGQLKISVSVEIVYSIK